MRFHHALLAMLLTWPALFNAQSPDAEQHPGVFRAVRNADVAVANATPAARQAALDNLTRIIDALKHSPAISMPVGYDVSLVRSLRFPGRTAPMRAGISGVLFLYDRNEQTGQFEPGEEGPGFAVTVNDPLACAFTDLNQPYMHDDAGEVFFEPKSNGTDHGYAHYPHYPVSGCTLVTTITRPLWLPVSRERVLTSILENQRKGLQELRDMMARLKASLPQAITPELQEQLKKREMDSAALEAELAHMTPAERGSQAYFWPDSRGSTPIVGAGHEGATALVTTNRAYLDSTLLSTRVQTLSVYIEMPQTYQWYNAFKGATFKRIHGFESTVHAR